MLVERGVDAVDAAEIITRAVLHGASSAPKKRSAGAIRQERYRRNKASHVTDSDGCDASGSLPDKEVPPAPPQEINPLSPTEKKNPPSGVKKKNPPPRGTRIPADFEPDIAYAVAQGLPAARARTEAENFRDYWSAKTGQGATKLDWPATWRQWVRNARDRYGGNNRSPPASNGRERLTPAESARRRLEEIDREQASKPDIPEGRFNFDG